MSEDYNTLYIDIDALFDTRYALLTYFLKESYLKENFQRYLSRVVDELDPVSKVDLARCYKVRDKRLIEKRFTTLVSDFIKDFIYKNRINSVNGPESRIPKIVINVYPYNLDAFEISELVEYLEELTEGKCDIDTVDLDIERLTPSLVKSSYSIMIKYDYVEWLEHYSKNEVFKNITAASVTLLVPALYLVNLPNIEQAKEFQRNKTTPFKEVEKLVSPLINLQFMPVEFFSTMKAS